MRRMQISRIAIGVSLAGAAMLGACSQDTATILDPLPNRAFNFVLTREGTNVPRGTVVTTRVNNSITAIDVQLQGLEVLRDPYYYQMWMATLYADGDTVNDYRQVPVARIITTQVDTSISAAGDFVPRTVVDTVLDQPGIFNRGGPGTLVRFELAAAARSYFYGARPAGTTRILLVAIDSNPAAPTPPDQFGTQGKLWVRSMNTAPAAPVAPATTTTRSVAVSFGTFHGSPALEYVFVASGRGRGAVLENENILVVDDSSLSRPPVGYYYATALVTREDGDNFNNVDTIPLGPQHAPYPRRSTSLFNADIEQVDEVVQVERPNPQIFAAQTRVDGDSVPGLATTGNPFRGVALVLVTLESKFGTDAVSPVTILAGASPQGIRLRD
jgi:hypothetical protein